MYIATLVSLFILVALTIFQVALICGAPLGHFAWGGSHKVLPRKFRIASASSILIYGVFATFILSGAGIVEIIQNDAVVKFGLWVLFGYSVLGIAMNALSRSKPERYVMTPITAVLALCFFVLATS